MRYNFVLLFLLTFQNIFAQSFNGVVVDKSKIALISATLQIKSNIDGLENYTVTDAFGQFSIKLNIGDYTVITRYLGYRNDTTYVSLTSINEIKSLNIVLSENKNLLNEVEVIGIQPSITYKKDTITFFADSFAIGDERKLRELLDKLPGLSVEGNQVTYKGKPVTKLLVENRDFFTGSVSFGINNLPADAVSTVEVLQNYSEVPFLKDKFYNDQAAINIKLKKNKRNIVFGDVEGSISQTSNHDFRASSYFYNPKYTSNLIVNSNTLGREVLSFEDKQYIFSNKTNYVRGITSSDNQLLDVLEFNPNFYKSGQKFASLFQNYNLNNASDIKLVAVYDDRSTSNRSQSNISYFSDLNSFEEKREVNNLNNNRLLYGQLDYTSKYNEQNYLKLRTNILLKNQNKDDLIDSSLPMFTQARLQNNHLDRLNGNIEYYKEFNKGRVLSLSSNYSKKSTANELDLSASSLSFISQTLGLNTVDSNITQEYNIDQTSFNIDASFTIPLSENADIAIGYVINNKDVVTNTFTSVSMFNQRRNNSFDIANHLASVSYLKNSYGGQFEVSLGLQYANFFQSGKEINRLLIVPKVNYKRTFQSIGDIRIDYTRNVGNPSEEQLTPLFQILSVDDLRVGNNSSYITSNHNIGLGLYKMSILKLSRFSMNIRYSRPSNGNVSNAQLFGAFTLRRDTIISGGNQNLAISMSYGRILKGLDISPSLTLIDGRNQIFFNNVLTETSITNIIGRLSIQQIRKGIIRPSISIQYVKSFSEIGSTALSNDRINLRSAVAFKFKNLSSTLSYQPSWVFNSNRAPLFFNNTSFEIRYFKKNQPWEIAISGTNLTQNNSNFSLISNARSIGEQVDFLFPRQVLVKVTYKF